MLYSYIYNYGIKKMRKPLQVVKATEFYKI